MRINLLPFLPNCQFIIQLTTGRQFDERNLGYFFFFFICFLVLGWRKEGEGILMVKSPGIFDQFCGAYSSPNGLERLERNHQDLTSSPCPPIFLEASSK